MRRLLDSRHATRSLFAGTAITLCSLPYVFSHGPRHGGWLLTFVLWPVALLMWQICLAWTPPEIRNRQPWRERWFPWLVGGVIALALVHLLFVDSLLAARLPQFFPESRMAVLIALPWVAVFQPLALVATPFAFGCRLTGKSAWGLALVIVFSQIMVVNQAAGQPLALVLLLTVLIGLRAALLGLAYIHAGFGGAAIVSGLFWARFFLHLAGNGS